MKLSRIALVAALVVLAMALVPVALAGKGGGAKGGGGSGGSGSGGATGGTGTITGPVLVIDKNGNGAANYGDTIMFNVSTSATSQPYVDLKCFQNGKLIAEGWRGYFSGALDTPYFSLGSPQWAGGAADCTAYLDNGTAGMAQIASLSFHVNA